mgnify:CR=1 FL=1
MGKKIFNEDRYVNPYTDFGFKKLFGIEMNKYLILSFINTLLHGKEKIKSLTYLNTEHLGRIRCVLRKRKGRKDLSGNTTLRTTVFQKTEAYTIPRFPYKNKGRKGAGTTSSKRSTS